MSIPLASTRLNLIPPSVTFVAPIMHLSLSLSLSLLAENSSTLCKFVKALGGGLVSLMSFPVSFPGDRIGSTQSLRVVRGD